MKRTKAGQAARREAEAVVYLSDWAISEVADWDRTVEDRMRPYEEAVARQEAAVTRIAELEAEQRAGQEDLQRRRNHLSHADREQIQNRLDALRQAVNDTRQLLPPARSEVYERRQAAYDELRLQREQATGERSRARGHLVNVDRALIQLHMDDQALDEQEALLKQRRARLRAQQGQAREAWTVAAERVGFPGRPTVDLPPQAPARPERPGFIPSPARLLYDPSLLVGINATEADVARREAFESELPKGAAAPLAWHPGAVERARTPVQRPPCRTRGPRRGGSRPRSESSFLPTPPWRRRRPRSEASSRLRPGVRRSRSFLLAPLRPRARRPGA